MNIDRPPSINDAIPLPSNTPRSMRGRLEELGLTSYAVLQNGIPFDRISGLPRQMRCHIARLIFANGWQFTDGPFWEVQISGTRVSVGAAIGVDETGMGFFDFLVRKHLLLRRGLVPGALLPSEIMRRGTHGGRNKTATELVARLAKVAAEQTVESVEPRVPATDTLEGDEGLAMM